MNLVETDITTMDLQPQPCELSPREKWVADVIAQAMKAGIVKCPMGLFIWRVCSRYEVNHKKIARHLGGRKKNQA